MSNLLFVCPICDYSVIFSKNVNQYKLEKSDNNEIDLGDIILYILEFNSLPEIEFNTTDIFNTSNFKELDSEQQETIKTIILKTKVDKSINNYQYHCMMCGFSKKINNSTKLYSKNLKKEKISDTMIYVCCECKTVWPGIEGNFDNIDILKNDTKNYSDFCHDNTLPRTKKYICPNKKCITHKNFNKKEAIFFKK
jgi:hypothetical protein